MNAQRCITRAFAALAVVILLGGVPVGGLAQTYSRTEQIVYHDDPDIWVLGQVAKVTCVAPTAALPGGCGSAGTVMSQTSYDATYALPVQSKSFGKVQQTLAYDTTSAVSTGLRGTLKTVTDGNNKVTTLTAWSRGIPGKITYPATTDQPTPVFQQASINPDGTIATVTDENGFTTAYDYDAMGRLTLIDYPNGDTVPWANTQRSFTPSASAQYGLPAGHWVEVVNTGNGRKVTRYDGLWRPVVENTYINGDASSYSFVVKRYDAAGRLAFQSYPVASLSSYTDALKGVYTDYDALDRVTKVRQDWEGAGQLTTTTEYLTGFKTRVTPPKGQGQGATYQTTTSYLAWDQPTTDFPTQILHPESTQTHIFRDVFGKPTSIVRRNTAGDQQVGRVYVYNQQQELCKSIEPETNATVYQYDGAGNLAWSAAGLGLPSGTNCDTATAEASGRAVYRLYDARNRLKTLSFPDTRGDQDWTYTPDGLPATVTTYNLPGIVQPRNHYTYNKRRLLESEQQELPNWYTNSIDYRYNVNGHLDRLTYPSNEVVDFAVNAKGQVTAVTSAAHTYASNVTYYPSGAIASFTYGNGVQHSMTQNTRQLPASVFDSGVFNHSYAYDANGNVGSILDHIRTPSPAWGNRDMQYDALDRLKHVGFAQLGGNHHVYFTYDALDNIATWKQPDAAGTGHVRNSLYCYNANNRLVFVRQNASTCSSGAATNTFTYDDWGNVKVHNGLTFDFDYGNRLREVLNVERYRYDAYGRRILANHMVPNTPNTGIIYSQYAQNGQLLYQRNTRPNQSKTIDHIYLSGSLIAQREVPLAGGAATVKYLHTDALGSPIATTGANGAMIGTIMDYEPYGKPLDTSATIGMDRPGYTGHVRDVASGLNYMQQRYYDPQIGRFLSVDPVTALSNPTSMFNRYKYAANNPYRFTDPDGRCEKVTGSHVCGSTVAKAMLATSVRSPLDTGSNAQSGAPRPQVKNSVTRDKYEGNPAKGEAKQASRLVGLGNVAKAYSAKEKAEDAAEASGLPGAHNGPADALRHCTWSCEMTRSMGSDNARLVGDNHEAWGGAPTGETQMDLFNNRAGRDYGLMPGTCSDSCLQAIRNGTLITTPEEGR